MPIFSFKVLLILLENMLLIRHKLSSACSQARAISGYKINSERYPRKKIQSNYEDEEMFQERIDLAVLDRGKSKLRGFEKVTYADLLKKREGHDPNAPFRHQHEANKYRSVWRYYKAAENERRKQIKSGVWWKNLNFWLKREQNRPVMKYIGLEPTCDNTSNKKAKISEPSQRNVVIERLSRQRKLILDIDQVTDDWQSSALGKRHIYQIANHYNIFTDLFIDQYFHSVIPMEINYSIYDDMCNPVYFGNELSANEAKTQPYVQYDAKNDKLYTLLLTNPDGNLEENEMECVHWLIGNIPGNDITQGEILVDYMQPIPARGTGYQRHIFILFEQRDKIDFDGEKRQLPCESLRKRQFNTSEFYKKNSDILTPAAFLFFQCKWDVSVQKYFQEVLKMAEPVYEYEKISEEPRLATLCRHNSGKTLRWLSRFMPKEMVYPDGSSESQSLQIEAAVHASTSKKLPSKEKYPIQNVY